MHTRQEVLDMALALPGAVSDMPFDEDFDTTVLRHGGTGKCSRNRRSYHFCGAEQYVGKRR